MRVRYLVAYDVADAKRLRRVHRVMRGFGDPLQYSVFACDLSAAERVTLIDRLTAEIHEREDSVLIVRLGPSEGRGGESIEMLGKRVTFQERTAVIV